MPTGRSSHRPGHRAIRRNDAGFTLVEAIIAIVITGIIAGIVAVFIARPVQGYMDSVRRADMTDVADLALKRMALDIRTAIPNTVRVDASGKYIEFIPARTGGRYCSDSDSGCNTLSFTLADNSFDVLGPATDAAVGEFLVIYNTGQTGLDAYAGTNVRKVATGTTTSAITFSGSQFQYPSPSNRFQITPATGPVTFACEGVGGGSTGTGSLNRYTGYDTAIPFHATQPTSGLGTARLLANRVSACSFRYQATNASNGLISLSLTIKREDESITLVSQFHVDNLP